MKQLAALFALLVATLFFAAWLTRGGLAPRIGPTPGPLSTMKVGDTTIKVGIADTPEEHEKGLAGREEIKDEEGLLFVMPPDSTPTFWMKGMKFAIDIIWIKDNAVIGVTENLPAPLPETPDSQLLRYQFSSPVDYVLEVKAGMTVKNNIKEGAAVELPK